MKILFLTHRVHPEIGGIEVNSEILARGFALAGHDVRVMTWSPGVMDESFTFPVVRRPGLKELIRQHVWADLVYENNPCIRLAWPAVLLGKPTVVALRTWLSRRDGRIGMQDRLKVLRLARARAVIAISEAVRRRCWSDAVVIGNPYRDHLFRILPDVARDRDFAFVGRLVSDKGVDLAIEALDLFLKTGGESLPGEKSTLTIIGEGPERKGLERLVGERALGKHVHFIGKLRGEELVRTLNRHRFLLVPSRWEEPFGNVALEGMACGCVPIVSDGGGLPDAVGNSGLIHARGDDAALADAMRTAVQNPILIRAMQEAAPRHLRCHRRDVVVRRYLDVLEAVVPTS